MRPTYKVGEKEETRSSPESAVIVRLRPRTVAGRGGTRLVLPALRMQEEEDSKK